jgi:hypothetical protein
MDMLGRKGGAVEPQIGADAGRTDRMVEENLPAGAKLTVVLGRGDFERCRDEITVEAGVVLLDPDDQVVQEGAVLFDCLLRVPHRLLRLRRHRPAGLQRI